MKEFLRDVDIGIEHLGPMECQPYSFSRDGNFQPVHAPQPWTADYGTQTIRGGGRRRRRKKEIKALRKTAQELQESLGINAVTLAHDGESLTVIDPQHMQTACGLMKKYSGKDAARI